MLRRILILGISALLVSPGAASASLPGHNGRIAFMRDAQIYTVLPNGSGVVKLTSTGHNLRPSWSANGSRIVFQRCCFHGKWTQVWTMQANGSGKVNLSRSRTNDSAPSFYPGGRIVFVRNGSIWRMNADGTAKVRLSSPPAGFTDDRPKVSPSGGKIAFERCCYPIPGGPPDGGVQIFVMNADGTGAVNLSMTAGTGGDFEPDWSPGGTTIVFIRCCPTGPDRLYLMDANGANQVQLSTVNAAAPAYSPDGTRIAFESYPSSGRIDTIPASGGTPTQVIAGFQPSWQPLP